MPKVATATSRHEAGVSLIAVMVAVAVTGILTVIISTMMTNSQKAVSSTRIGNDLNSIQVMLSKRVNCSSTMNGVDPTTCSGFIALRDAKGNLVVAGSSQGQKFGEWTVRASCSPGGLNIRAARVNPQQPTGFNTDPLTGKVQNWTAPLSQLFTAGPLCQEYFGAGGPPPPFVSASMDVGSWHVTPHICSYGGGISESLVAGTASCPAGYTVISGTLFCYTGTAQGTMLLPDINAYWGSCCPSPGGQATALSNSNITAMCALNR